MLRRSANTMLLLPPLLAMALGCTGSIDEGPTSGVPAAGGPPTQPNAPGRPGGAGAMGGSGGSTTAPVPVVPGVSGEVGTIVLARLSRDEYTNAVRELLRDESLAPARDFEFSPEQRLETGFRAPGAVSLPGSKQLRAAAEELARKADLAKVSPCAAGDPDEACATKFISTFGRRAYRRPVAPVEADELLALFKASRTAGVDRDGALRVLIEAFLQSPDFVYKWPAPTGKPVVEGKVVKLDRYQLAARLSFLLWASPPDDALNAAADAGALDADAGISAQVRRLLGDKQRTARALARFSAEWLDIADLDTVEKDKEVYPQWTAALRATSRDALAAFVKDVVLDGDGKLSSLLGATHAYVNADLAKLYGVEGVTGGALVRGNLDATKRRGLLTQVAFLAGHGSNVGSHPTKRGTVIYGNVLCGGVPPPAPDVPALMPPRPGVTTRERFEEHVAIGGACASCHALFDPWGFPFESFKGLGELHTTEQGRPIRTDATPALPGGERLQVDNAAGLARALESRAEVRACYARQWYRYAAGRLEDTSDAAAPVALAAAFESASGDVRELLHALALSKGFRYRLPAEGEVLR